MKVNQKGVTMYEQTTIAAIATPPGEGGIGIIRISGEDALEIVFLPLKKRYHI